MTDQPTTEALAAIKLCAEKGMRFTAFDMLINQFDYAFNDAFDLSEWLIEHPENFSAWIAINSHVPPPVSFDELRNGQMIVGDSLCEIYRQSNGLWIFLRDIRNSPRSKMRFIGSTEAEARAFWEDMGWDLLYPVLNG